jgi:DNA-binding NarL/FixJ family response regulator
VSEPATPEANEPSAGEPVRVVVVDDHPVFRRGLRVLLEAEFGIDVVGEAGDAAEAIALASELTPDVVVMDVRLPDASGVDACRAIKETSPSTRTVMLTVSDDEADLYESIRAGASGYLLKEVSVDEVASAVRAVHGGQSLIGPSLASKLLTEMTTMSEPAVEEPVPAPKLTRREMEVLRLLARGMNNRDIAASLYISENTVKNHVRNILEKLQLHSRMQAVVYAVRERLLEIT